MKFYRKIWLFLIGGALIALLPHCTPDRQNRPNIVLILIDDLGYGDIGCYGNTTNLTPNIDLLAQEGLRLTDFHSNGPMCTPTRAALLTGMYQNRLGPVFEGPLSGKTQYDKGMPLEVVTIAELLGKAGYVTGMFGKWHLGYQEPYLPVRQGFDEFAGLVAGDGDHHTHIDRWGREDWWHDDSLRMEAGYSVDLLTRHSIDFINKNHDRPFFLYLPHLAIHFPWQGPDDPPHRKRGISYEHDKWGIIEDRENVHPHVKAMVEAVDKSVGKIMETLRQWDLDENTLVIFTSDNGGYIHYNHIFKNISSNGPWRGQKAEVYEGGHRVPFIARWPGHIGAGTVSDQTAMTFDLFPTFAALAGISPSKEQPVDGVDLAPLLFRGEKLPERTLFWKMDEDVAVRKGPWKLVKTGDKPYELYNLDDDPGEQQDLAESHEKPAKNLWQAYENWLEGIKGSSQKWETRQ